MIHCSAPGKLMIMGEHAVLHGKKALVAAVDQRLHVYLEARDDQTLEIQSALGSLSCDLKDLKAEAPFTKKAAF